VYNQSAGLLLRHRKMDQSRAVDFRGQQLVRLVTNSQNHAKDFGKMQSVVRVGSLEKCSRIDRRIKVEKIETSLPEIVDLELLNNCEPV